MSFAQQRMWMLDQLLPDGSVYNSARALRLVGNLNVGALRRAVNEVVRRHEVLRTHFAEEGGEPVQVIAPALELVVPVEDLGAVAPGEREAEAMRRAKAEAQDAFILARGPLIRVRLLRLSEREHWLLLTLHHVVIDGWSYGVLERELSALYAAYATGKDTPLADLPVQYADYALWQRERLQGEVLARRLAYWKEALHDLPLLELPSDRPRPAVASYGGGRLTFELDEGLTRKLREFGRRERTTLFMTLLAAFYVLLYRYGGQEDMAVGVPIAGRTRVELEGLIGFFVNTLVLRGDLSGEPSFREVLGRVRERALSAYEHQELPFEKLVEELAPRRDLSRNPLCQVMLTVDNTRSEELALAGLVVEPIKSVMTETAKFDLHVHIADRDGVLDGRIDYATDLFDHDRIERMVGHWKALLEAIVDEPERKISHLPLLTEAERRQLFAEWNDTAAAYPRDRCVHQLFEAQAERTPAAVAIVCGAAQLTYGELNARANQLAHHLRGLGVGPEVLVGLCLERSLHLVVAMLGILKAGGAYVPLDPGYPQERLGFMLAETSAPVLVTQHELLGRLPEFDGRLLCLDRDWGQIGRQAKDNPACLGAAANLAYVIFTSGSTGRPKGVEITHSNFVNFLCAMPSRLDVHASARVLAITPVSFDISGLEIFLPLTVGAMIQLVPCEATVDGAMLRDAIASSGATLIQATPATWRLLLEAGWVGDSGHTLISGGEALPADLAKALTRGGSTLWNMYAPTETTIYSTMSRVDGSSAICIGRPIANTRTYVLDPQRQAVPVGVPGELYIGGDGVARGYLRRPEITAEKFLRDPFAGKAGSLLYRTGDRVRYQSTGSLEFLGRLDHQVKIRGFRIELGEIESALCRWCGARQAVAVVREDEAAGKCIVAYVSGTCETAEAMTRALRRHLPAYMIPAAIVALESLPLTVSGKIDRKALPCGLPLPMGDDGKRVLARTPVEKIVAGAFARSLGVPEVGVNDDFFGIGGHSLLAMQVLARINDALGTDLPVRALFEAPTVAMLAELFEARRQEDAVSAETPAGDSTVSAATPTVESRRGLLSPRMIIPRRRAR